jgi:hypothetical protein
MFLCVIPGSSHPRATSVERNLLRERVRKRDSEAGGSRGEIAMGHTRGHSSRCIAAGSGQVEGFGNFGLIRTHQSFDKISVNLGCDSQKCAVFSSGGDAKSMQRGGERVAE